LTKATGPGFRVHFRRRRKGLTDYGTRLSLLRSDLPRLVVRKTNRHIIVHVAKFGAKGDVTLCHATSAALARFGFAGKCNAPSAYLTGFLVGKMAVAKKVASEVVLDVGLHSSTQGSIVFCALKGAIDAGLKAPLDEEKLPPAERIRGEHLKAADDFEKAKKAIGAAKAGDLGPQGKSLKESGKVERK